MKRAFSKKRITCNSTIFKKGYGIA